MQSMTIIKILGTLADEKKHLKKAFISRLTQYNI
jgi:hypothetical protein